jgi:nucleoid-associated protein YgaU
VLIPNSGKLPMDGAEDVDASSGGANADVAHDLTRPRDLRAHAAKDVSFEAELPRTAPHARATSDQVNDRERAAATSSQPQVRPTAGSARVEAVQHVVERQENFWTISRLYYSSGRYYRALWKANADKYPDINRLHVGDVIVVPAVEDLDPAEIVATRSRAPSVLASPSPPFAPPGRRWPAGPDEREGRSPRGGRRPAGPDGVDQTDTELDLPAARTVSRRERIDRRADLPASVDDGNNDEPETRTAARPRRTDTFPPAPGRPVYKVRPYDTLRSIARDTLSDARRAGEILELNRELIDDPSHLIIGQILELPEDARTSLRRSSSSRN